MSLVPVKRALLSVSDKTGLVDFAKALARHNIDLVSTGGTAKMIRDAGLAVKDISEITNFPEMMDGRVKTLHPKVHGGLLNVRDNAAHAAAKEEHGIADIDLVVVNLYPFEATVARGADYDTCIENIDIGGPAMIRSAAKNHKFVNIITDAADYDTVIAELDANDGATGLELRKTLAARAYARTAAYDSAINTWFAGQLGDDFAETLSVTAKRGDALRYGENPHQAAAVYLGTEDRAGVATAEQVQGKALSYNNLGDTDAAFELVAEFLPESDGPACAIIKHGNPCGVAKADSLAEAYRQALACDPVSAFGGIIALNQPLDKETAEEITRIFTEVVIAPSATDDAKAVMAAKKNLRLLTTGGLPDASDMRPVIKQIAGGFLVQNRDGGKVAPTEFKVVTKRQPTEQELNDMAFAFTIGKHVKSNAIVYVKDGRTVGIGAGQMSRVDSSRIAAWKAKEAGENAGETELRTKGSVVSSDAFFPFADGLLAAVEAGATAVIQPGGSIRDEDVIAAADEAGIAMVFTGMRHFRH